MTAPFGTPFPQAQLRSVVSTLIVEPVLGLDVSHSALNIPDGATPNSDNFIMREGRLEPRPMLSRLTDTLNNAAPLAARVLGGTEVIDVLGTRYLLISSQATQLAWLPFGGGWSYASYTSAYGVSTPPGAGQTDYWDWAQIFHDRTSENLAVGGIANRNGLFCWAPTAAVYSTLTGSPGARYVCAFSNYLLAANTQESAINYIQRVRWCDRGSASSWTGGLSGFADLYQAKGGINRLLPLENRVAVFFDDEIWQGQPVEFPGVFQFASLDDTVGCPYPWTATKTPQGIMFMARNFQLYLLPKEGGPAQPIGQKLHRSIRDVIIQAPRAFGVYDSLRNHYQLYFSSGESGSIPHRAAFLHLDTGAWAPQSFASAAAADIGLTRGFSAAAIPQPGTLTPWDSITTVWNSMTVSWDDLQGVGNERQGVVLGSSAGTIYSLSSVATMDDGQVVRSFWESDLLGKEWPRAQKTIQEVCVDYAAPSASSLTVRALGGATFSTGTNVPLPAVSGVSQSIAYLYQPSRYAAVRVESEGQQGTEIHRLYVTMRIGGR